MRFFDLNSYYGKECLCQIEIHDPETGEVLSFGNQASVWDENSNYNPYRFTDDLKELIEKVKKGEVVIDETHLVEGKYLVHTGSSRDDELKKIEKDLLRVDVMLDYSKKNPSPIPIGIYEDRRKVLSDLRHKKIKELEKKDI